MLSSSEPDRFDGLPLTIVVEGDGYIISSLGNAAKGEVE